MTGSFNFCVNIFPFRQRVTKNKISWFGSTASFSCLSFHFCSFRLDDYSLSKSNSNQNCTRKLPFIYCPEIIPATFVLSLSASSEHKSHKTALVVTTRLLVDICSTKMFFWLIEKMKIARGEFRGYRTSTVIIIIRDRTKNSFSIKLC